MLFFGGRRIQNKYHQTEQKKKMLFSLRSLRPRSKQPLPPPHRSSSDFPSLYISSHTPVLSDPAIRSFKNKKTRSALTSGHRHPSTHPALESFEHQPSRADVLVCRAAIAAVGRELRKPLLLRLSGMGTKSSDQPDVTFCCRCGEEEERDADDKSHDSCRVPVGVREVA